MIKIKHFCNYRLPATGAIRDYQEFIKNNQNIEILAVNVIEREILLTYKETSK